MPTVVEQQYRPDEPARDAALSTDATTRVPDAEPPIIYFDGICGLCSRAVDFVIRRDHRRQFRFAPLQGETARRQLNIQPGETLTTIILTDECGRYVQSDAVWRVLDRLGGRWRLAGGCLRLVPVPLRNVAYRYIANRRYRWFGKRTACRLPTSAEREQFLP